MHQVDDEQRARSEQTAKWDSVGCVMMWWYICLGTACYVKGSGDIINKFSELLGVPVGSTSADGKYSLEATRCIGACGLAPVLTVNGEVYGRLTVADVPEILKKYVD